MPYRSEKQRRFMHSQHPEIAARWDKEYGGKIKKKTAKANSHEHALRIRDSGKPTKLLYTTTPRQIEFRAPKIGKTNYYNGVAKSTNKFMDEYMQVKNSSKKKAKLAINNKLKGALGQMDPETNEIEINVRKHKGDKAELASTIKHELMHVKHPKMTEREVYKRTAKTKIPLEEQSQLLSKLKRKSINYKSGALKRRFKMKRDDKVEPGTFINKMNKERLAILGLV